MNEIQSRSNHNYSPGTALMTPLNTSIHTIEQASMNKVSKFVLFFLAYITFGLPAAIGLAVCGNCLSGRTEVINDSNFETSCNQTDLFFEQLQRTLEASSAFFDGNVQLAEESVAIDFVQPSTNIYTQGKHIRLNLMRTLCKDEISVFIKNLKHEVDKIGLSFERVELFPCSSRRTFSIKLMIPDQFDISKLPKQYQKPILYWWH